ncbi:ribosomal protein S18-alanine N-acetyltransferase [Nocardioides sp. YIM 152588]|uniref:ribosomal protein S18-alanine N-acetyltransferase n=1 Tax=Nocardioides sp. YIM 152588 TaxID=3158259 RepID=UPI0032E3EF56
MTGPGDPVRVRPAGPGDLDAVVALEAEGFAGDAWSPTLVADGLGGGVPTVGYLVVEDGDGVQGYAVVSVVGEDAELQRIVTASGRRRTGLGRSVLAAVREHAAAGGADRLLLEVREDNAAALALYAADGFTEIARRRRYYRDGATAVILERHLDGPPDDAGATGTMEA